MSESKTPIEPFLIPFAIMISALMISSAIIFLASRITPTSLNSNTVGPISTVPAETKIQQALADSGIDTTTVNQCINDKQYIEEITADKAAGKELGIEGTPSFVIGKLSADGQVTGQLLFGAYPLDRFESILSQTNANESTVTVSIDNDAVMGTKETAKFAIVEFVDFACPYCIKFHQDTYSQLIERYINTGEAIFVYRDYPLTSHEPAASQYALAAECVKAASDDNKYFEFTNYLFTN